MMSKKHFMIMAGEYSGDIHGMHLVSALKQEYPDSQFYGLGGMHMQSAGVDLIANITSKHAVGFVSNISLVCSNLGLIKSVFNQFKEILKNKKPGLLIFIDNQGLNMALASIAKKHNVKTLYYIPPQEWLWGSDKGGRKVAETVDTIVSIFKKEHDFYSQFNKSTYFFGHPMLDIISEEYRMYPYSSKIKGQIGLFPGSRSNEIELLLPVLKELAIKMSSKKEDLSFVVSIANQDYAHYIKDILGTCGLNISFTTENSHKVIAESSLVLGASGTLSLECAIIGTPMIVLYKLKKLDYFLAKNLMKIDPEYISMPNIIADRMIFPEYIQYIDCDKVVKTAFVMLNSDFYDEFIKHLKDEVIVGLGQNGAVDSTVSLIKEMF